MGKCTRSSFTSIDGNWDEDSTARSIGFWVSQVGQALI